jgi:hypothetical protein
MNTNIETFNFYATGHSGVTGHILAYLVLCLLILTPVLFGVMVWKVWKKISN